MSRRMILLGAARRGKGDAGREPDRSAGDSPRLDRRHAARRGRRRRRPSVCRRRPSWSPGELVSDEIVIGIAEERLSESDDAQKGLPARRLPAHDRPGGGARGAACRKLGVELDCCLALTVDNDAIVERLLKRAEIEGRADDNEETIRERMREYDSEDRAAAGLLQEPRPPRGGGRHGHHRRGGREDQASTRQVNARPGRDEGCPSQESV